MKGFLSIVGFIVIIVGIVMVVRPALLVGDYFGYYNANNFIFGGIAFVVIGGGLAVVAAYIGKASR